MEQTQPAPTTQVPAYQDKYQPPTNQNIDEPASLQQPLMTNGLDQRLDESPVNEINMMLPENQENALAPSPARSLTPEIKQEVGC